MGFAGGFPGGYCAAGGAPFGTVSGGVAAVNGVAAGADVLAAPRGYLVALATGVLAVGVAIETR